MKYIFIVIFLVTTLFSKNIIIIDSDFDGVIDTFDKCPGSSFDDIVDAGGCKKDPIDDYKFLLSYGYGYSEQKTKTSKFTSQSNSFSAFVSKGNYLFGLSNDYINVKSEDINTKVKRTESGFGDLTVMLGYMFNYKYLSSINFITKLATCGNDALSSGENDYSIQVNFQNFDHDIFMIGNVGYNYLGDGEVEYENYFSGSLGFGKEFYKKFYFVVDFVYSGPVVKGGNDELDVLSLFVIPYNKHYQFNISYTTNLTYREDFIKDSISLQVKATF